MDRTPYLGCAIALASVIACGGGPDCKNPCSAIGATQCSGSQVQTCKADSNGCLSFSAPTACGAQQFCSAATNACIACVNSCATGATQCSGTQVQTCTADANGCLAFAAPATCPSGQSCFSAQNRCLNDGGLACPSAPTVLAATSPVGPANDPAPTCLRPVVPSALPAGQVNHLGVRQVGDIVPFDIPTGTGGFSIVSQGVNAQTADVTFSFGGQTFTIPNSVVPLLVTEPDGATFYDDNAGVPPDSSGSLAIYDGLSPSTGAFTAPNTSAALSRFAGGVPTGTWQVTVSDLANECVGFGPPVCVSGGSTSSTYDVTVVIRPGPVPAQAPVDVGIYLVTNAFTAATAVANPAITRMISTFQSIYSRAGLCLGNVTLYDVPAWAKDRFATGVSADATGPCDELDQMFTLSVPGNALNFFFVDDITQPVGGGGVGSVVGIDGTIPGPSSFGGTVHSGGVVNASNIGRGVCGGAIDFTRCGSDVTAYITAHEGGHYMGLYHTTEAFGNFFDPIADTGTCACNQCAPIASRSGCATNPTRPPGQFPTEVTGADCNKGGVCDGSQDLMFWLIDETSFGDLSPQQGQIVRANPVTH